MTHRRDVEGLRAIAVLAVLLYHVGAPGLGGGFTARGNRMLFINERGRDGKPFSGLDDERFAASLQRAADQFGGIASVSTGRVIARLVERPDYSTLLGGSFATLERLQARRVELGHR